MASAGTSNKSSTSPRSAEAWSTTWKKYGSGAFAYSAYYISSDTDFTVLEIIVLLSSEVYPDNFRSARVAFLDDDGREIATRRAQFEQFKEHRGSNFVMGLLKCQVTTSLAHQTIRLSIGRNLSHGYAEFSAISTNVLLPHVRFAYCGSPLFGNRYTALEIVKFLEYYVDLGVEFFHFYNFDQYDPSIKEVFKHYTDKRLLIVHNWTVSISVDDTINYGQQASLNDCLFRTKETAAYVVTADIDEYLVLADGESLDTLVEHGAVDCAVSRTAIVSEPTPNVQPCNFSDTYYVNLKQRQNADFGSFWRTKYICRPLSGYEPGVHLPYPHSASTFIQVNPPADRALFLHARDLGNWTDHKLQWVEEPRVQKYIERVDKKVKESVDEILCGENLHAVKSVKSF